MFTPRCRTRAPPRARRRSPCARGNSGRARRSAAPARAKRMARQRRELQPVRAERAGTEAARHDARRRGHDLELAGGAVPRGSRNWRRKILRHLGAQHRPQRLARLAQVLELLARQRERRQRGACHAHEVVEVVRGGPVEQRAQQVGACDLEQPLTTRVLLAAVRADRVRVELEAPRWARTARAGDAIAGEARPTPVLRIAVDLAPGGDRDRIVEPQVGQEDADRRRALRTGSAP